MSHRKIGEFIVSLSNRIRANITREVTEKNIFRLRYIPILVIFIAVLVSMDIARPQKIQNESGIPAKNFSAVVVDSNNIKWFITEAGIVSFNGEEWKLHNKNSKVPTENIKGFALELNPEGQELWIASPNGATVASLPVDAITGATTYHTENASIPSKNVVSVAIGKSFLRWFGTDKGVSAFRDSIWLSPSYEEIYPAGMFEEFAITSMATSREGDSLYVGTEGAGVVRVYKDVDGISGASSYAKWGPIILPSDKIYSIYLAIDGSQWFGTDQGIARHTGNKTTKNWKVFTVKDGLVNNFVQAIASDSNGKLWFGTKGGVSVFDGSKWTSFTMEDGLNSNNILCLALDNDGVMWLGTDNGVNCCKNGEFSGYK